MDYFTLTRTWWDFAFENPEKVKPIHSAVYLFAVEHCNRLGWKQKFGFPSNMAMEAIGVKKWHTYISAFNDLVEWGFFNLIQKSKNQHSSNIISLLVAMPKNGEALDKALSKHGTKHGTKQGQYNKTTNNIQDTSADEPPKYCTMDKDQFKEWYNNNEHQDQHKCRALMERYKHITGISYYYDKKEIGQLSQLLKKFKSKDKKQSFRTMLNFMIEDEYFKDKITFAQMNSLFNNISEALNK